ncbi:MAG: hypothetical protein JEZ09_16990 [Salinivirgaceae bacterium]|nr:hypothetical protein [Salinivirgaceae bacterium]
MKNKNIPKNTEGNGNLKSALLKILTDLNVELPYNMSTLKIDTDEKEKENIELENIKNEE